MDLSIIIPTYNRRQRLLNNLHSIYNQLLSKEIKIVILNNASNYDVERAIKDEFSNEDIANLKVINHKYNIGGALNIALPFYFCETKWLWILGDDDESRPDSLEIIKDDIENRSEYSIFKYSFWGEDHYNNEILSNMRDAVDYQHKTKNLWSIVYCSNAIYEMDRIRPYVGTIMDYAYSSVAAVEPIFLLLDNEDGKVILRDKRIVNYIFPETGTCWNGLKLALRTQALWDFPFKAKGETLKQLWALDNFQHFIDSISLPEIISDKVRCKVYFRKTFSVMCVGTNPLLKIIYKIQFYILLYFHYDIHRLFNRRKDKKNS